MNVALNLPRSAGEVLTYARHVAARLTGNTHFPSPSVPVATLLAHAAELDAAEVFTRTGTHGAAATRNLKLEVVHSDLMQLRNYVQTVAGQHGEDAVAVVVSAGMSIKRSSGPKKPDFAVKPGKVPGSVALYVRHPGIASSFDWQSSSDGTHWTFAPSTVRADARLDGLTPGTRYSFRFRTLTRHGTSEWSDPLTLIVG